MSVRFRCLWMGERFMGGECSSDIARVEGGFFISITIGSVAAYESYNYIRL